MSKHVVECTLASRRPGAANKKPSPATGLAQGAVPAGRVPRIARLMALALRFEQLIRSGAARDYAELARLGQVSRARVTQITNLLHLAPDIREAILFLPRVHRGRDPVHLDHLQALASIQDWRIQRRRWNAMLSAAR